MTGNGRPDFAAVRLRDALIRHRFTLELLLSPEDLDEVESLAEESARDILAAVPALRAARAGLPGDGVAMAEVANALAEIGSE